MAEFMAAIDTAGMSGATKHAAENCSLIYAGACIAIDAGLLSYRKGDVRRAIRACFRDVLRPGRDDDPLMAARRILRRQLRSDAIFDQRRSDDQFDAREYPGYVAMDGGRSKCVVRAASLRE
ncbi:MAG TPA: hypothetical protein VGH40_06525 [Roseiarcus sp.]